jgi:hypothetical protein
MATADNLDRGETLDETHASSAELEAEILGTMLLRPEMFDRHRSQLNRELFSYNFNRGVFDDLKALDEQGIPPAGNRVLAHRTQAARLAADDVSRIARLVDADTGHDDLTPTLKMLATLAAKRRARAALALAETKLRDGESVDEVLESALAEVRNLKAQVTGASDAALFCTAAEIDAMQIGATEWIAPGLIAPGAVTEVIASVKKGKTTLILDFVRGCVNGGEWIGRKVVKTPVVYLTEQTPQTFRAQARRAGLGDSPDVHVLFFHKARGLTWEQIVKTAVDKAQQVGARVLIVDTFSKFAGFRGDGESSSGEGGAKMEPLMVAAANGLAVVSLRHARKSGGDVSDAGRGSGAITGSADIIIVLQRPEGNHPANMRELKAVSRFPDETPECLVIAFENDTFKLLGDAAAVEHDQAELGVVDQLPTTPEAAINIDEIMTRTKTSRGTVQRVLNELMAAGKVERLGTGKRGDPYRYFLSAQTTEGLGRNQPNVENGGDWRDTVSANNFCPPIEKEFGQEPIVSGSLGAESDGSNGSGSPEMVSDQTSFTNDGQKLYESVSDEIGEL